MLKGVYNPKAVIPHAASLRQASAHCAIFPTAASRRSLGRVSVPVWPVALSGRLPVDALVGHHPTNKLIGRGPIPDRKTFQTPTMQQKPISGISPGFPELSQSLGQVTHVLLTRSPLTTQPKPGDPFDLHVLSTPPAFVLSQDQTLQKRMKKPPHHHSGSRTAIRRGPGRSVPTGVGTQQSATNKHGTTNNRHTVEFSKNRHNQPQTNMAPQTIDTLLNSQKTDTVSPDTSQNPERHSLSVIPTLSDLSGRFSALPATSATVRILRDHEDSASAQKS